MTDAPEGAGDIAPGDRDGSVDFECLTVADVLALFPDSLDFDSLEGTSTSASPTTTSDSKASGAGVELMDLPWEYTGGSGDAEGAIEAESN